MLLYPSPRFALNFILHGSVTDAFPLGDAS